MYIDRQRVVVVVSDTLACFSNTPWYFFRLSLPGWVKCENNHPFTYAARAVKFTCLKLAKVRQVVMRLEGWLHHRCVTS